MYLPNWEVSLHGQVAFPSFLQRIYSVFGCGVASVIRHGITPARLGRRLADGVVRRISRSEVVVLLRLAAGAT